MTFIFRLFQCAKYYQKFIQQMKQKPTILIIQTRKNHRTSIFRRGNSIWENDIQIGENFFSLKVLRFCENMNMIDFIIIRDVSGRVPNPILRPTVTGSDLRPAGNASRFPNKLLKFGKYNYPESDLASRVTIVKRDASGFSK